MDIAGEKFFLLNMMLNQLESLAEVLQPYRYLDFLRSAEFYTAKSIFLRFTKQLENYFLLDRAGLEAYPQINWARALDLSMLLGKGREPYLCRRIWELAREELPKMSTILSALLETLEF